MECHKWDHFIASTDSFEIICISHSLCEELTYIVKVVGFLEKKEGFFILFLINITDSGIIEL